MARLENWRRALKLVELQDGSIVPAPVLAGTVSGHPSLDDGMDILTSPVKAMDEAAPPQWAQTMNTRYELGKPYNPATDPAAN